LAHNPARVPSMCDHQRGCLCAPETFLCGRGYAGRCKIIHVTICYMTCIHNVRVPGRGFRPVRAGICNILYLNFREFSFRDCPKSALSSAPPRVLSIYGAQNGPERDFQRSLRLRRTYLRDFSDSLSTKFMNSQAKSPLGGNKDLADQDEVP
jgi:hypothetical protein